MRRVIEEQVGKRTVKRELISCPVFLTEQQSCGSWCAAPTISLLVRAWKKEVEEESSCFRWRPVHKPPGITL